MILILQKDVHFWPGVEVFVLFLFNDFEIRSMADIWILLAKWKTRRSLVRQQIKSLGAKPVTSFKEQLGALPITYREIRMNSLSFSCDSVAGLVEK